MLDTNVYTDNYYSKEKEVASLQQKVEDNSSDISGLQRKIRELEVHNYAFNIVNVLSPVCFLRQK